MIRDSFVKALRFIYCYVMDFVFGLHLLLHSSPIATTKRWSSSSAAHQVQGSSFSTNSGNDDFYILLLTLTMESLEIEMLKWTCGISFWVFNRNIQFSDIINRNVLSYRFVSFIVFLNPSTHINHDLTFNVSFSSPNRCIYTYKKFSLLLLKSSSGSLKTTKKTYLLIIYLL